MADDALTVAITEALRRSRMVPYEDGRGGWLFRDATPEEQAEQVAQVVREHTAAQVAAVEAERDALVEGLAHVVRDHDMPPNKDSHGYDYRMGWWDAVLRVEKIVRRGLRSCDGCPGDYRTRAEGLDAEAAPEQDEARDARGCDLTGERDGSGER